MAMPRSGMSLRTTLCFIALVAMAICAPSAATTAANSGDWPPRNPVQGDWRRIQLGEGFSFEAPADTQPVSVRGIDSAVGGYKNDRFSLAFDYGAYSNSLSPETPWSNIDGHRARLEFGRADCQAPWEGGPKGKFVGMVYVELRPFAHPFGRLALTMTGCAASEAGLEELERLYLSLRFNSDRINRFR
jgi:hypothetical protein